MLALMANRPAKRSGPTRSKSWRIPLADVPTDEPAEMAFEALLPVPGQAVHWLLMRRRIANFCLRMPDRQKARKLYSELMAICERQEVNRPRSVADLLGTKRDK
jgi:hypothetical protein